MLHQLLGTSVAVMLAALLAACGSSTSDKTTASSPTAGSTATGASAAPGATTPISSAPNSTASGAVGTTPVKSASPVSTCDLVTQAEAAAALGFPVNPGKPSEDGSSCTYNPVDTNSAGDFTFVTIQTEEAADFTNAKGSGPVLKSVITPVAGIGKDAFFMTIPNADGSPSILGTHLHLLKGSNAVDLTIFKKGASEGDIATLEKSMAALIVGRLP